MERIVFKDKSIRHSPAYRFIDRHWETMPLGKGGWYNCERPTINGDGWEVWCSIWGYMSLDEFKKKHRMKNILV